MKAEGCPESMPALVSTGTGVDIQDFFKLIIHNFQDVRMPANKDVGLILTDQVPGLGIIMPGRTADMRHQHLEALALPETEQRATIQQAPVVTIADDPLQRLERGDFHFRVQASPEVPGMPDLVDILEKLPELRPEYAVRIRYETDIHGKTAIQRPDTRP